MAWPESERREVRRRDAAEISIFALVLGGETRVRRARCGQEDGSEDSAEGVPVPGHFINEPQSARDRFFVENYMAFDAVG